MSATNDPSPSHSQLNSLLEHYQSGRYEDAEKLAISITQQFPHHPFSWKVLAAVLKKTGRISEALVANQKAVEIAPQDAEAHSNLGNTLKELGRLEQAEESYRQAIALRMGFFQAHNNLANILKELGRVEEAKESDRKAIFLSPAYAEETEPEITSDNLSFKTPSPIEYPMFYRVGMGTENVGGFLRAMALMLRPKTILEIGAGYKLHFCLGRL